MEIKEKWVEALASIAKSQIAKNGSFNKIAMAFEALANRKQGPLGIRFQVRIINMLVKVICICIVIVLIAL